MPKQEAHSIRQQTPPYRGGRNPPESSTHPSITAALFLPHTQLLATSGSGDTTVKLWDMRSVCTPVATLIAAGGGGSAAASMTSPIAGHPQRPGSRIMPPTRAPRLLPTGGPPLSSPGAKDLVAAAFACRSGGPFGVTCMAVSAQGEHGSTRTYFLAEQAKGTGLVRTLQLTHTRGGPVQATS